MTNDNQNQTSQETGPPAENCWLRSMAKVLLTIGLPCLVIGVGLMARAAYVTKLTFDRIAESDVVPRPQELAAGIAAASMPWRIGIALAAFGVLATLFGGILWLQTRNACRDNRKDAQLP